MIADNLIAQKKMVPMLIVMPWGHVTSPRLVKDRSEMQGNDEGVEKELLQDIVPFVESTYRAAKSADKRAIVGLSMGGGQSITTGLTHLDTFHWVGGFSSATPEGDLDGMFPGLKENAGSTCATSGLASARRTSCSRATSSSTAGSRRRASRTPGWSPRVDTSGRSGASTLGIYLPLLFK